MRASFLLPMLPLTELPTQLAEVITQFPPFSEPAQQALNQLFKPTTYLKGSILVTPGQSSDYLYFIEKGLLRAYYFEEGKEITAWILAEGGVGTISQSFYQQIPSTQYLETLEESTIFRLHYRDFIRLQKEHHEYIQVVLHFTQQYFLDYDARIQLLCTRSPLRRYQLFEQQYPNLRGRLAQSVLASYLNMSYYQISRIRTQLSRDK